MKLTVRQQLGKIRANLWNSEIFDTDRIVSSTFNA